MQLAQADKNRQECEQQPDAGNQRRKLMVKGQIQAAIQQVAREELRRRSGGEHLRFDEPGGSLDHKCLPKV